MNVGYIYALLYLLGDSYIRFTLIILVILMRSVWEHFSLFPLDCQKWDTPLFLLTLSTLRDWLYFLGRPGMLTGYSRQHQSIAYKGSRTWGRQHSISLSRALAFPLLFSLARVFISFQIFIICCISQGVCLEKKGKDHFSVWRKIGYLSITSNCCLPSHWIYCLN